MDILSIKPGHDGSVALVRDGNLIFSLEAEKDSFARYSECHAQLLLDIIEKVDKVPDVIAVSGWFKSPDQYIKSPVGAGYFEVKKENSIHHKTKIFGKEVDFFSSSHLRSHILSAYGLSPFPNKEKYYCLVWEGILGGFYEIDEEMNIQPLGKVLDGPGNKYGFIYSLANPYMKYSFDTSAPGKVMALASFSDRSAYTPEEKKLVDLLLSHTSDKPIDKNNFKNFSLYNAGVESKEFKNFAGKFSDTIFDKFHSFAEKNLKEKYPLIITGGCGLNCDWNTNWKRSGLFSDVFVPPVPNDSGSAIGTAIDAQLHYSNNSKVNWTVYSGEEFINDFISEDELEIEDLDYQRLANFLYNDKIIAWAQGKYEIGPRALGNRSIIASPLSHNMKNRINYIKKRESYRPVAPICIEDKVSDYFEWQGSSPYMLYFQKLRTDKLPAITHVDNTARVQTVSKVQNIKIYDLLEAFGSISGFSVLCNTSLNFNGAGFINRRSDLFTFCKKQGLDGFVINDKFYKL